MDLKKFSLGKNLKTIGLELRKNYFNIAEVVWKDEEPYLNKAINVMINEPDNDEMIAQQIKDTIAQHQIKGKLFNLGIEGQNVIIRLVKFPLMTSEELDETLKWESDRYLPLPPDDLLVDFYILEEYPEVDPPEMMVVLVGVRRSAINRYIDLMKDAGVALDSIEVTPFSYLRIINSDDILETTALLNIVDDNTEMMIIKNGILCFNRVIENTRHEELVMDIQRSLDFFQTQHRDTKIEQILVVGSYTGLSDIMELLTNTLDVPIVKADLMSQIHVDENTDKFFINNQLHAMASALGLAIRNER